MQTYIDQLSGVLIDRYTYEFSWLISGPSAAGLNFALVCSLRRDSKLHSRMITVGAQEGLRAHGDR